MELVEMDVDAKKVETHDQLDPKHSKSALPIQTLEVLSLFFNVKLMAKELAEFDVSSFRNFEPVMCLFSARHRKTSSGQTESKANSPCSFDSVRVVEGLPILLLN